jgi:hypothetical protein
MVWGAPAQVCSARRAKSAWTSGELSSRPAGLIARRPMSAASPACDREWNWSLAFTSRGRARGARRPEDMHVTLDAERDTTHYLDEVGEADRRPARPVTRARLSRSRSVLRTGIFYYEISGRPKADHLKACYGHLRWSGRWVMLVPPGLLFARPHGRGLRPRVLLRCARRARGELAANLSQRQARHHLGLAAVLVFVDGLGWRAVAAMFDRERLATDRRA